MENSNIFKTAEGNFLVPFKGIYRFTFNGYVLSADFAGIYANVYGATKRKFIDRQSEGSVRQITFQFSMHLESNDQLSLDNTYDSSFHVYEGLYPSFITFTGFLIKKNQM